MSKGEQQTRPGISTLGREFRLSVAQRTFDTLQSCVQGNNGQADDNNVWHSARIVNNLVWLSSPGDRSRYDQVSPILTVAVCGACLTCWEHIRKAIPAGELLIGTLNRSFFRGSIQDIAIMNPFARFQYKNIIIPAL